MNAPAGQMHYAPPTTINPAVACIAGMTAQEAGNMDEAVLQFEHALLLAPALVDVRLLLAYALGAHGRNSDAHQVLDETPALETLPESDLRRLADAAAHLGATAIALKTVRVLAAANQNDADLQSMLGALLHRSGAVAEAGHVLNRAVLRWPTHVATLMNTARLLVADGHYAGALRNYDRALKVSPQHATARWHRGLLRLTMGDLAGGWSDHEARRTLPQHLVNVPSGMAAWNGKNPAGKTLLLWGEQGLGDQIQGVRFAATLASLGARVMVRCAPTLTHLFANVEGAVQVLADDEPVPQCDAHVPMLSIPFLLKLFDETSYGAGRYLQHSLDAASPAVPRVQSTQSSHSPNRTRVGFAWAGSPGHTNDHLRSLPVSQLTPLLDGVSVQWISLQVGTRAAELKFLPQHLLRDVVDVASTLINFADTAHVICALDRVVTVDTSVAHVAGALGVPTLLLLPFVPDWRWQLAREDSPWYKSIRVIRQPSPGDWASVVHRVHRELSAGGQARAA